MCHVYCVYFLVDVLFGFSLLTISSWLLPLRPSYCLSTSVHSISLVKVSCRGTWRFLYPVFYSPPRYNSSITNFTRDLLMSVLKSLSPSNYLSPFCKIFECGLCSRFCIVGFSPRSFVGLSFQLNRCLLVVNLTSD